MKKTKTTRREAQQKTVDKLLETVRNVSVDGIGSGQADTLTPLDIIVGSLKVIQMMGVDGSSEEAVNKLLEESRRVYDKASKEQSTKNNSESSFIDPFPSDLIH